MRQKLAGVSIFLILAILLSACGSVVHVSNNPFPTNTFPAAYTPTFTFTPPDLPVLPTPTLDCTDGLTFVTDLTVPDGTVVAPGTVIDKQWQVKNSGSCNWDRQYSLRLVSGDAMGVAAQQALYPARAGTDATIEIMFKAPADPGDYISEWQAFDPSGIAFGDSFFMKITVQ